MFKKILEIKRIERKDALGIASKEGRSKEGIQKEMCKKIKINHI